MCNKAKETIKQRREKIKHIFEWVQVTFVTETFVTQL